MVAVEVVENQVFVGAGAHGRRLCGGDSAAGGDLKKFLQSKELSWEPYSPNGELASSTTTNNTYGYY